MAAPKDLEVSVPDEKADRPAWRSLSLLAAGCFAAGMAWPLALGVDLSPRPPGLEQRETAPDDEPEPDAPEPSADEPEESPGPAAARLAPRVTFDESVRVDEQILTSCEDGGRTLEQGCDHPAIGAVVIKAIEKLSQCDAAMGTSGVLSLGVELDFTRHHVAKLRSGKSTTLSNDRAEALLACADSVVIGTPLPKVEHRHEKYWVYYLTRFVPPGSPVLDDGGEPVVQLVPTSGVATVGFQTAIVREAPNGEAPVVARLLYGTRVEVTGRMGDWYHLELPSGLTESEQRKGWVHAKALGL